MYLRSKVEKFDKQIEVLVLSGERWAPVSGENWKLNPILDGFVPRIFLLWNSKRE